MNPKLDIHDYEKRYESSIKTLEKAEISQKNKDLILKFNKTCALENLSIGKVKATIYVSWHGRLFFPMFCLRR